MAYVFYNPNPDGQFVGDCVVRAINVQVWPNCCETISVINTSDQAILVQNANIIINRPDLVMTR